jgi:lipoyl-dependent peroxiredoxin
VPIRIRRRATASWHGNEANGSGRIAVGSGAIDIAYSLRSRVGDEAQTNPEELIGAAISGCYVMSLASALDESGYEPREVTAVATVNLEESDGRFSVTRIGLDVTADVPGVEEKTFYRLADMTRVSCPIARALAGTDITLEARLAGAVR